MTCVIALTACVLFAGAGAYAASAAPAAPLPDVVTDDPLGNARFLLFGSEARRRQTLRWIISNDRVDMVAALVHVMPFHTPEVRGAIARTLRAVTGERHGDDWFRWTLWLEAHPDVQPFQGFDAFLSALFSGIDPEFARFVYAGMPHRIRVEEIVWGGVRKEGIPALTNPTLIEAAAATRLDDDELVFGVVIGGDARAYPFRYMDWHEMLNDVIGGVPVSLAYCTLCGAGILYDTRGPDGAPPHVFGSSGLLYRSNKLMYDQATHSLWNQFTGEPVTGALADSGIALPVLPLVISSWREWRRLHPSTRVLAHETGYSRNYRPGAAYGRYFAEDDLMFPAVERDRSQAAKSLAFVLRITGAERAWPLAMFEGGAVINDRVGVIELVLIGDAATRTVRAYRRNGERFERSSARDEASSRDEVASRDEVPSRDAVIDDTGARWVVDEDALTAADGRSRARLPGHVAYWFAFSSYFSR